MNRRALHKIFKECQCEHPSHYDNRVPMPGGKAGHKAGAQFPPMSMHEVQKGLNPLRVCEDCRNYCWKAEDAVVADG